MSFSLALGPDDQGLILGTNWFVRAFGREGKERWSRLAPGVAWAVNVTADGRLVVAAFGDGTIRWFRYDNGQLKQRIDVTNFVNAMTTSNTGVVVYSASSARELSLESPEWKNGIFTRALIEGLEGAADGDRDGEIMTSELEGYLAREVRKRTEGVQTPVVAKLGAVPDLLLARPR